MANYDMFPDLLRDDSKNIDTSSRGNSAATSVSPADNGSTSSASASPASSPKPPDPNDLLPALPTLDTAYTQQAQTAQDSQNQDMANLLVQTALTTQATDQSNSIYDDAIKAKDINDKQQTDIYTGLNDTIQKANAAIALSDSSDPMDHLKLWSMQLTDPLYTDTGNEARMEYYRDASSTVAAKGAVEQDSFQNQIDAIKQSITKKMQPGDDLATILKLQTSQGADRIAALEQLQQSRVANLKNQDDLQKSVLGGMDDAGQLQSLLAVAKSSPSQTINHNGITLTAGMIDDRLTQINDRQYAEAVQANAGSIMAVQHMQMPDVIKYEQQALASAGGKVKVNGTDVSLGLLQDRKRDLMSQNLSTTSQDLAVRGQTQNLMDATDDKWIGTHLLPELNTLKQNGGVMPNGHVIPIDKINNEILKRQQDQLTQIQNAASIASIGDVGQASVSLNKQYDAVLAHTDANGPLAAKIRGAKQALAVLTNTADPKNKPAPFEQAWAAGSIQLAATTTLPATVKAEATRIAGQDKEFAQAYTYMLQGQPIPADLTRGVLTSRLIAGKDRSKWLSSDDNGFLINAYGNNLQKLKADAFQGNPLSTPDLATMKQQAADAAVDQLTDKQSTSLVNQIFGNQVTAKNNPLSVAGITSNKILELIHGSDATGIKNYISDRNLPKDKADALTAGGAASLSGDPNAQIQLGAYQNAALLQNLDQISPGLSKKYLDWWNSQNSTDYMGKFVQNGLNQPAQSMQNYIAFSQQLPKLGDAVSAYGQGLQQGDDVNYQSQFQKDHNLMMTFNGKPANGQIFLLDRDKSLTDAERQDAMKTFIQPMLTDATQQGKDYGATMSSIEQQLRDLKPDDPAQKKLLNKIMAHRGDSYEILDSLLKLQDYTMNDTNAGMNGGIYPFANVNPVFGNIEQNMRNFSINNHIIPNPIDQAGDNVAWYQSMNTGGGTQ